MYLSSDAHEELGASGEAFKVGSFYDKKKTSTPRASRAALGYKRDLFNVYGSNSDSSDGDVSVNDSVDDPDYCIPHDSSSESFCHSC